MRALESWHVCEHAMYSVLDCEMLLFKKRGKCVDFLKAGQPNAMYILH